MTKASFRLLGERTSEKDGIVLLHIPPIVIACILGRWVLSFPRWQNYILMAVILGMQQFVSMYNYQQITPNEVKKGMIPSAENILLFNKSRNNRCVYCQASGEKKPCHMQEDVADKTMEMIARSPSAKVTIEFQGGEPLINFRVIRYIIEKAKTVLQNKDVQFTLVSNLSLLTEEMAIYFKDNNVSVSTSLDGPANIHNLNRPSSLGKGTYETTLCGIDKLRKLGLSPGAIQTTTAASLAYPEVIVDTYAKLGLRQLFLRPLTRLGAAAKCWDKI